MQYEYRVAGVTFGNRQKILASVFKSCKQATEFIDKLNTIKVRLRQEPENTHDENAVAVDVFSKERGEWYPIGYIPNDGNTSKFINLMIITNKVNEVKLWDVGWFQTDDGNKYYAKLAITIGE